MYQMYFARMKVIISNTLDHYIFIAHKSNHIHSQLQLKNFHDIFVLCPRCDLFAPPITFQLPTHCTIAKSSQKFIHLHITILQSLHHQTYPNYNEIISSVRYQNPIYVQDINKKKCFQTINVCTFVAFVTFFMLFFMLHFNADSHT